MSYPVDQQCAHVRQACPETDTILTLPHLQAYFCASPFVPRPVVFLGLLIWLALLFSMLGISASDFFCPNLATIATVLGLDENVAGVTFLAVGNGSPDLFATFSAMKAHSGSLAVGELLGAASFIVSVVVGSMCVIKPFHVNPGSFLRDVGFFTVAVSFLLWILHDGTIHKWEAGGLVVLYFVYVAAVVLGAWWEKRREEKRRREVPIRNEFVDDIPPRYYESYRDDGTFCSKSTERIWKLIKCSIIIRTALVNHSNCNSRSSVLFLWSTVNSYTITGTITLSVAFKSITCTSLPGNETSPIVLPFVSPRVSRCGCLTPTPNNCVCYRGFRGPHFAVRWTIAQVEVTHF